MFTTIGSHSTARLRGQLLESLIVEIRLAKDDYQRATAETDRALAKNRLLNAVAVFDGLANPPCATPRSSPRRRS